MESKVDMKKYFNFFLVCFGIMILIVQAYMDFNKLESVYWDHIRIICLALMVVGLIFLRRN